MVVLLPPMVWFMDPVKVTVPVEYVKVPLLVKLPYTVKVFEPLTVRVLELFMVMFLMLSLASNVTVLAIVTVSPEPGTPVGLHVDELDQLPLVVDV